MFKVYIIESERGWGSRVDEIKEFENRQEADDFIKRFNSKSCEQCTPDWYMYAEAGY